jgi:hypothetical protein
MPPIATPIAATVPRSILVGLAAFGAGGGGAPASASAY